jgi:hypothetical protein
MNDQLAFLEDLLAALDGSHPSPFRDDLRAEIARLKAADVRRALKLEDIAQGGIADDLGGRVEPAR